MHIIEISSVVLVVFLAVSINRLITLRRIRCNQKAWDEFSKGMNEQEKWEVYLDWCEKRKQENDWTYYYFPRM